ncbi:MAG: coproporphyrinogen III oxidase [Rhodospirillaceae bacterium]|nr:coproporphyrinogen III oxidase [Rhodospirillaceae bacterium]
MHRLGVYLVLAAAVLTNTASITLADESIYKDLSKPHAESAKLFMTFSEVMTKDVLARVAKLNGSEAVENHTIKTDNASYDIILARGGVIEKAGILMVNVTGDMPPRIANPIFNHFFSIDIHPKTSLVGMVHLAFTLGVDKQGRNSVYGWMDMMPAANVPEDVEYLRAKVDAYFAKMGRDPAPHRQVVCTGEETADRTHRRKPSCAGVSLYPPPPREVTVENTQFVAGAFETVYNAYFDILEKRKNQTFGPVELKAQAAMRRNWLEDQLFADPFSSRLVPYAAWSLANAPPSVEY